MKIFIKNMSDVCNLNHKGVRKLVLYSILRFHLYSYVLYVYIPYIFHVYRTKDAEKSQFYVFWVI